MGAPSRYILYYACGWDSGRGLEKGGGALCPSFSCPKVGRYGYAPVCSFFQSRLWNRGEALSAPSQSDLFICCSLPHSHYAV
ncbi:hypothetical protein GDO81_006459 [Engystomops pustulosus]|uniref:Uncharacterized protein n=1 Tax=Engystomops pustulosus TaxID=76066 RepID=A0AAV7CXB7_ENGPU|nr:hypothetical protein GDO81_006459 [Engystomops pustulosus]